MPFLVTMNFSLTLVFSVLISSAYCVIKTQEEYNELMEIRKGFNVYNFSSSDYPAMFAIIAGIGTDDNGAG
uniref:Uncharacterized protein n=1 Tax=Ditylenchus dipsaci TaxID=166011 RepID=A0A915DFM3_9BILA